MFGLVALTFLATCFVPTAALVVLMAPIVLNTSADMGLSPHGLMMAIAMAASASFMTPVSHPANILVMGPGGYRFSDYLKIRRVAHPGGFCSVDVGYACFLAFDTLISFENRKIVCHEHQYVCSGFSAAAGRSFRSQGWIADQKRVLVP